jgi:hypothetical protein
MGPEDRVCIGCGTIPGTDYRLRTVRGKREREVGHGPLRTLLWGLADLVREFAIPLGALIALFCFFVLHETLPRGFSRDAEIHLKSLVEVFNTPFAIAFIVLQVGLCALLTRWKTLVCVATGLIIGSGYGYLKIHAIRAAGESLPGGGMRVILWQGACLGGLVLGGALIVEHVRQAMR